MESCVEQIIERSKLLLKSRKTWPLGGRLIKSDFSLIKLLNLLSSIFDVASQLISLLHCLECLGVVIKQFDLFESRVILFKLHIEVFLLLVELGHEDFFLCRDVLLSVLDHLSNCHWPHLLIEGVLDVFLLVDDGVLL